MHKLACLNSEILKVLADLGHTDTIVIADCGLPVPSGVKKIDLALKPGSPSFIEVVAVLVSVMQVEHIIVADELATHNKKTFSDLEDIFSDIPSSTVPHEQFKLLTGNAKAIIRSGEITPYANIILRSGVIF